MYSHNSVALAHCASSFMFVVCVYSDMTSIVWDSSLEDSIVSKYEDHTEFVLGVDFNLFNDGQIATCSWDETVRVFRYQQNLAAPRKAMPNAATASSNAPSAPSSAAAAPAR
jgi:WD40 repeat protein